MLYFSHVLMIVDDTEFVCDFETFVALIAGVCPFLTAASITIPYTNL
jgi:hypothetical protein